MTALTLQAMALDVPHTPGHPNKHPFTGILTRIDTPSDAAPSGSNGKRVILSRAAAEAALPGLLGMGVNYTDDLAGHNVRQKIGAVTAATIDGDALRIEGFLYAADFPAEVARISAQAARLGFSYEIADITVEDPAAPEWVITACAFTGAAILYKHKAAYTTTQLAAMAEEHPMSEEILTAVKATADALERITDRLAKIEAQAEVDKAAAKAEADKAAAKAAEDAKLAASADAEAKRLKELEDKLASQETVIADLKAAAARHSAEPQRKTLTPQVTALLARSGVALPGEGQKLSVVELDKSLKDSGMSTVSRLEAKNAMARAGLLAE